ncbi:hypothetical protein FSP39_019988 [Pinctada imbricata]|uniref:PDZ domain-containing protein n=1 Tax=Pinctada imbricata TaxID=66713 RepID=A0AA89BQC4_PINIB|nr:hypothetical protein FSP39_019988 [Pinctada imbricata]
MAGHTAGDPLECYSGIYVTYIHEGGPAQRCGLQTHDKILQVNGHDFTLVTHRKAVEYIQRKPVLNMLVYRKGLPKVDSQGQTQFQAYAQDGYPMQYQ